MNPSAIDRLPAIGTDGRVNVVIETPRNSRGKFKFDPETGTFTLNHILPAGSCFPYDFGFIPSTRAADGDPLDVLVLVEVELAIGLLVKTRLIGIIEAEQTEVDGRVVRNDRALAVPVGTHADDPIVEMSELGEQKLSEIEAFFTNYDRQRGKDFRPIGRRGPAAAMETLRRAILPSA